MTTTGQTTGLLDVIATDHEEVEAVLRELEYGTTTPEHRRQLADHLIAELVRHSVAEEHYLYPLVRKVLPDGDRIADAELAAHADVEKIMVRLEGLSPADPRFEQLLGTLINDIRKHFQDEETRVLSRLKTARLIDELADLGEKMVRAKRTAPTLPHPATPERRLSRLIPATGTGLIERLRKALTEAID